MPEGIFFESSNLFLHGVWLLSLYEKESRISPCMFLNFLTPERFSQPVRDGDSACYHIGGEAASGFKWQRGVKFGFETWREDIKTKSSAI